MIEYRKVMNRSLSVVACQYWEEGERVALLDTCGGVFFAEPMFIFCPGKGVGVYYNYSDPRQDPQRAIEYFNTYPESFQQMRDVYLRQCAEVERMIATPDVSLGDLYHLLVSIWPTFVYCAMLGKWDDGTLNSTVQKGFFDLRASTDKVFYDADAVVEKLILAKVGSDRVADAEFFTTDEIISGVYPSATVLDQRKKGFVYFKGELHAPESIPDFVQSLGIEIVEEIVADVQELMGQSASTGIVKGPVKVIFEKGQMGKMQKGDILVASMTTPDFMPAIRLAGSLVTDEGGITCHAAIVARELGVPCVIGTRTATKVLHDGDVVEVDATKGIVTILSRA